MIKIFSLQTAAHPNRYEIDKTVVWGRTVVSGIGLGLLEYTLLNNYSIRFVAAPLVGLTAAVVCYFTVMGRASHTLMMRAENSINSNDPLTPDTVAFIKSHRPLFDQLKQHKNHPQAQFDLALHFKDADLLCTFLNQDKGISVTQEQLDTLTTLLSNNYTKIRTSDVLLKYVYANDHITDAIHHLWVNIHYYQSLNSQHSLPNLLIRAIEEKSIRVVTYLLKNHKAGFYNQEDVYAAWSKTRDPQIAQVLEQHGIPYEPSPKEVPEPPRRNIPDLSASDSFDMAFHLKKAIASNDIEFLTALLSQIDNLNGLMHSLLELDNANSAEILMLLKEKGIKINASALLSKVIQRDVYSYTRGFNKKTHLQLLISMGEKPSPDDLSLCRSTHQHELIPILQANAPLEWII